MNWAIRDRELKLNSAKIMGIVNLTEDSFSDGGKFLAKDAALQQCRALLQAGADILDLGAESTRPQAEAVPADIEAERLVSILKELRPETDKFISIDTTKPSVAERCLEAGADIINDVSGLQVGAEDMAAIVRRFGAGLVLMHRRGNPKTMQQLTDYADVCSDVLSELGDCLDKALSYGVESRRIVLDPGIGFAKTAEQNLILMRELKRFHAFNLPLLLGVSRKAFIGHVTGREVTERAFGTAAAVAWALVQGVQIFRVHDVQHISDVIKVIEAIQGEQYVRT